MAEPVPVQRVCRFAADARGSGRRSALVSYLFCIVLALGLVGAATRADAGDTPPRRIVSLLPSLTEIVCALDACDRLVGTDRYSNDPAPVRSLPKVGGGVDPSVEAVLALQPDLVLAAVSTRAVARLRELGLKVVALEPRSLEDLRSALLLVGEQVDGAAGRARGQALWLRLDAQIEAERRALPDGARGLRLYFEAAGGEVGGAYAAGPGSFTDDLMRRLGLVNIVPGGEGPYPRINPEFVVRARPDVLLLSARSARTVATRPGWASLPAVRDGAVCALEPAVADILVRAGPRVGEAAGWLARCAAGRGLRSTPTGVTRAGGA